MKLTKDTLIEGKIIKEGTELVINETNKFLSESSNNDELIEKLNSIKGIVQVDIYANDNSMTTSISGESNIYIKNNDLLLVNQKNLNTGFSLPLIKIRKYQIERTEILLVSNTNSIRLSYY